MNFRARLFWIISRIAHRLYGWFPIFGTIRGSVAIIRRNGGFVAIERNDGYGLCFPGGIAGFHEDPEKTVRREVREETGLTPITAELKFQFTHDRPFPTKTFVFEATAEGALQSSWEGAARVVSLEELAQRVVGQQRQVVDYLLLQSKEKPQG